MTSKTTGTQADRLSVSTEPGVVPTDAHRR